MAAPQILDLVAEVRPLDGELSDDTDWTPVPSLRGWLNKVGCTPIQQPPHHKPGGGRSDNAQGSSAQRTALYGKHSHTVTAPGKPPTDTAT